MFTYNKMSKALIPIIAVIALFVCMCCVLSLAGGTFAAFSDESPAPAPSPPASSSASSSDDADDDDDAAAAAADDDKPEGAKSCTRKVTATRTDTGNRSHGWGMNLRFKCNDTLVHIGSSGGGPRHKNVANFDGKGCPSEINKSNWEGTDTYPDKFDVSVSDCVN